MEISTTYRSIAYLCLLVATFASAACCLAQEPETRRLPMLAAEAFQQGQGAWDVLPA